MKYLFLCFFIALGSFANADIGSPKTTVASTIRSAQEGKVIGVDLEALKNRPKHSWTEKTLLEFLSGSDPNKLIFQKFKEINIYWLELDENRALVRLLEPRRIDFVVTFFEDRNLGCGGYLKITEVNP